MPMVTRRMDTIARYPTRAAPETAFAREALPHLPSVRRFALMLTRNATDAEDLVQDTFLRALRSWSGYDSRGACRSWLYKICRNVHLRQVTRRSRITFSGEPEVDAIAASALYHRAAEQGLDHLMDRAELGPELRAAIDALPDAYRRAVVLVDVDGSSYEDAAVALGVPIGTVRSRLFRARQLLQRALRAHAEDAGYRIGAAG